uniref:Cytochrome c oxidase subunit 3 n=1 Tax=Amegilla calceifera TaxID=597987 RepID=A0A7U0M7Y0_9HYME|nr:cytochrome c oxidase subunit III [Amegilla calceifera]QQX28004.1 cytochrome c oxidase subunit 3 [Amegilla calceifera]
MLMNFPFHMVTPSPWPFFMSLSAMNMMISMVYWFYFSSSVFMFMNMLVNMLILYQWWRDVVRESMFQGCHTLSVVNFLKFSMLLFIISELFFFISFFWTYFHNCVSPGIEIGGIWPPKMVDQFNPYDIPLLNSIILISSGVTVSWSHYCLLNNNYSGTKDGLMITILLGVYFTIIQYIEYYESSFTINDSIFGSIFFMSTGFHGFHVLLGSLMLLSSLVRLSFNHFSSIHHFNFESSLWYWHFVDVVWLFLYIFVYWWVY